ncbi:MAG: hypothetical protein GEU88_17265 [Solirubrobacterales bacterium]|nr:hypothetical protein [Solirubrobacterales bacterium]
MAPFATAHPSSAIAARLRSIGAECVTASCPECGRTLVEEATCGCGESRPRVGRLCRAPVDSVDRARAPARLERPERLGVRGEPIA